MGSWHARPEQQQLQQHYEDLAHKSGFSTEQIKNLHKRFRQLSGNQETISRANLDGIPALANNPIKKQIIDAFFDKRNQRQDQVGSWDQIDLEQFLMVMSHFRPPAHKSAEEERQAARKQKLRCGGGAAVQKRRHRPAGRRGYCRRGHVGSGQHQRAAHGSGCLLRGDYLRAFPTDSQGLGDGVPDAHPLFGHGHHHHALRKSHLLTTSLTSHYACAYADLFHTWRRTPPPPPQRRTTSIPKKKTVCTRSEEIKHIQYLKEENCDLRLI
ncbi:tescalcin a isoform X1 [Vanacampus margaritifer]